MQNLCTRLAKKGRARVIAGGVEAFSGRHVLLLQGPIGPFFARLARDLERVGARVSKFNFNGGDWLFYPGGTTYFGTMEAWPQWLATRMAALSIDQVFLFGDCRPIHRVAHRVATAMGIDVGVFEEGYLRPDFITLERHGVNGNSPRRYNPDAFRTSPGREKPPIQVPIQPVPRSYWPMVAWGICYFITASLTRWLFHYQHHRPIRVLSALPWLRSPLRKVWFQLAERGMTERLTGEWSGRFFLVPLQVYNDAQVVCHASTGGVPGFIADTIASFGRAAPDDVVLVFKHHPMDRGYCDYTRAIRRAARAAGCADRVVYMHDQHMPTILPHCRGTVVINSTAGLAAVGCGCPTITLGAAIYDMPGLTYQGPLDRFWTEAQDDRPDAALYECYRAELIAQTQINGNFYRRLDPTMSATGLIWTSTTQPRHSPEIVPFPIKGSSTAALLANPPERATI